MIRRLLLACAAVALALVGVVLPAYAADGGARITHLEQRPDGISLLVSVPAETSVELAGVTVTIAGQDATATAQTGDSGAIRRTAILAMDTSRSMSGAKFAAAKSAAAAYIAALPPDVRLGIVTFGGAVRTALDPTQDRSRATSTLSGLALSGGTLLYDGLRAALDDAGSEGQRSLLVLSDGADTRSGASLARTAAAIKQADALVQVVAVDQSGRANAALQQLAEAGKGTVIPADPSALAKAFADQAGDLARQVLVTAEIPDGLSAAQGTVAVTLPTSDGDSLSASAYDNDLQAATPVPAPAASTTTEHAGSVPGWALYAGGAAVAIGLFGLVVALLPRSAPSRAEALVTSYTERTSGAHPEPQHGGARVEAQQVLSSARTAAADLLKRNAGIEARIARALDGAGSDLKPAEWLLLHIVIAVCVTLLGLVLGRGALGVGLLFLALGVVGPWLALSVRRSRRRRRFAEALPDTLQLMAGSLSAGLSLPQTIDTVVREGVEPITGEFRRALVETRLGVDVEDALEGIANRFESPDFSWVVMAIRIQRQVGGNLAELFNTVAGTLRERQYLRRQVSALSAEGRLSAWVIGCLPPIFLIYLLLTNRSYLSPLFHDPRGVVILIGGGIWFVIGVWWMSRIVKVEV